MPPPPKALAQRPAVTTVLALAAPVTTKDRPLLPPVSNAAMSALLRKPGPPPPVPAPGRIPPSGQDLVGNGAVAAAQHAEPAPAEAAPAATVRPGPQADPKFATLNKDVQRKKRAVAASHPPPKAEAGAAQGAARPPKDDVEARGKTVNADKMNESKPKEFDKAAFIRAVEQAIADKAPKNLDQAEKFADSGKPAEIKAEVQGRVGEGKADSASEIATTTAAPPDTSAVEPKKVVPLAADRPPGAPATPDPANAVPDTLPPSATDLSAGPAEINQQMAGADVTETQLKKSNEPTFTHALAEKKVAEQDSAAAPSRMRAHEAQELQTSTARAKRLGATSMAAMAARRVNTGQKVAAGKTGAKSRDEEKRVQVTAILQGVFDTMKADVEAILSGLDKKVDDQFTSGEKKARDEFTAEHKHKIEEYKDQRYGPWWNPAGKGRWLRDLFKGLPPEVNAIYDDARKTYVTKLKKVITDVADTIGNELNRAKSRIGQGRNELQAAVKQLPADLQAIGKNAAAEFTDKFAELTQIVDDKGTELVDTLATKYTAALKSVDDEIAEEKENNKGLIDKAKDLINGVIQLIRELEKLIETVLAKAREAGRLIMRDPIGFLKNLISAVGDGLRLFMRNIRTHLLQGVMSWLLGKATEAGLQLPDKFDVRGVVTMLAGLLGLTPQAIWARITRKLPPQVAAVAEEVTATAVPLVAEVRKRGVGAMWDDLKTRVGDLRQTLLDKVIAYVTPEIVWAGISWILSMLNPATAFVRAVKLIIDIVRFIVTQARQIIDFVNAVLDAIIAIARGGTGGVPGMIERALAKAIPILLGFLAALLGLGGIAGKVKKIIQAITKPVGDAIDWVIDKVVGLLKAGWTKLRLKLGPKKPKPEKHASDDHRTKDTHKPTDDDLEAKEKQLDAGMAAALAVVNRFSGHTVGERLIKPLLTVVKIKHRMTSLTVVDDNGKWAVVGVVNPSKQKSSNANSASQAGIAGLRKAHQVAVDIIKNRLKRSWNNNTVKKKLAADAQLRAKFQQEHDRLNRALTGKTEDAYQALISGSDTTASIQKMFQMYRSHVDSAQNLIDHLLDLTKTPEQLADEEVKTREDIRKTLDNSRRILNEAAVVAVLALATYSDLKSRLDSRERVLQQVIGTMDTKTLTELRAHAATAQKFLRDVNEAKNLTKIGDTIDPFITTIRDICLNTTKEGKEDANEGDGSSEAAAKKEAETGKPIKGRAHGPKCKTEARGLRKAVAALQQLGSLTTDAGVLERITDAISKADDRAKKLDTGATAWDNRVRDFPHIWTPEGVSKVQPPFGRGI